MANDVAYPIPIGVTTSFANVQANVNTPTFTIALDPGLSQDILTVTFQPQDQNNPGQLTLTDGSGNVQLTMNGAGYGFLQTRGGSGFYFTVTQPANIVALTKPSILY